MAYLQKTLWASRHPLPFLLHILASAGSLHASETLRTPRHTPRLGLHREAGDLRRFQHHHPVDQARIAACSVPTTTTPTMATTAMAKKTVAKIGPGCDAMIATRLYRSRFQMLSLALLGVAAVLAFGEFPREHRTPMVARGSTGTMTIVDGDTVRMGGQTYRLVGFDTPEMAGRCARESNLAMRAAARLQQLVSQGGVDLQRLACACQPGTEGTDRCNYGRLCGTLKVGGRDVGPILISEGLARPYICGRTSCPPRQGWC
jgi:endonuclease YncB( thermonuclease family)